MFLTIITTANISSVYLTDLTKSVKNNSHVLKVMMMMIMIQIMGLDEIAESVITNYSVLYM